MADWLAVRSSALSRAACSSSVWSRAACSSSALNGAACSSSALSRALFPVDSCEGRIGYNPPTQCKGVVRGL